MSLHTLVGKSLIENVEKQSHTECPHTGVSTVRIAIGNTKDKTVDNYSGIVGVALAIAILGGICLSVVYFFLMQR